MNKTKGKKIVKKMGIYAGSLLLSVSSWSMIKNFVDENAPEFLETKVIIGKNTISI